MPPTANRKCNIQDKDCNTQDNDWPERDESRNVQTNKGDDRCGCRPVVKPTAHSRYTNSRITFPSTRCCGRPVGSLIVVVSGFTPRACHIVAKISPNVTGRLAACSPRRFVLPIA